MMISASCLAPMLTQNGKRRGRKPGLNSTLAQRSAANARERSRMRVLSSAFIDLKGALPWVPKDTKLSKLDTLKLAAGYIAYLKRLLDSGEIDNIDFSDASIFKKIDEQDNKEFIKLFKIQGQKFNLLTGGEGMERRGANDIDFDSADDCSDIDERDPTSASNMSILSSSGCIDHAFTMPSTTVYTNGNNNDFLEYAKCEIGLEMSHEKNEDHHYRHQHNHHKFLIPAGTGGGPFELQLQNKPVDHSNISNNRSIDNDGTCGISVLQISNWDVYPHHPDQNIEFYNQQQLQE